MIPLTKPVSDVVAYLERNAAGCRAEGPDWASLGRAMTKRANAIRAAFAKGRMWEVAALSRTPFTTKGDIIPEELWIKDDE